MAALSLRLTDDIEQRLAQEAKAEGRSRSELARAALIEFLDRRERERFMTEMVVAAEVLAKDPLVRQESLELAKWP